MKPLSQFPSGRLARIVGLMSDSAQKSRFAAMGLSPGSVIEMIQASPRGPFLIAVKEGRLALSIETAERIFVQPV